MTEYKFRLTYAPLDRLVEEIYKTEANSLQQAFQIATEYATQNNKILRTISLIDVY